MKSLGPSLIRVGHRPFLGLKREHDEVSLLSNLPVTMPRTTFSEMNATDERQVLEH